MTDIAALFRALEWLAENDPAAHQELQDAVRNGTDAELVEEIIAGVPDSVTGRLEGEVLDTDENFF